MKEVALSHSSEARSKVEPWGDGELAVPSGTVVSSAERDALIRSLTRVTRDVDAAEDCLQTAFVRLEEYRHFKKPVTRSRRWTLDHVQ